MQTRQPLCPERFVSDQTWPGSLSSWGYHDNTYPWLPIRRQRPIEKDCHFPGTYCIYPQRRGSAPVPNYRKRGWYLGMWEGQKNEILVFYFFFSMFPVGEDHRLFLETDILFQTQPVCAAEREVGEMHVDFWHGGFYRKVTNKLSRHKATFC